MGKTRRSFLVMGDVTWLTEEMHPFRWWEISEIENRVHGNFCTTETSKYWLLMNEVFCSKWNTKWAANSVQDQHHKSVILDARISKADSSKWKQMTQRFLFKTHHHKPCWWIANIKMVTNLRKVTQFRRPFISQDGLNLYNDF